MHLVGEAVGLPRRHQGCFRTLYRQIISGFRRALISLTIRCAAFLSLLSRSPSARGLFFIARCQRSSRALADALEISATRLASTPEVSRAGSSRRAAVSISYITFLLRRTRCCLVAGLPPARQSRAAATPTK